MVVSTERDGDIAVVTVDNPPVNALSQAVRQGLWDAAEQVDADPEIRAAVLVCAGRTFIAGADVKEFGKPPEPPHLPDVIARIEAAAKPWVAAIHGTALGGGFEVTLGCRFRVAAPSARVGLPEVNLGLVPGAGGTVRVPRLIAVEDAIEPVTTGKPVPAPRAHEMGLIDRIAEGELRAEAVTFAREALEGELPPPLSQREPASRPGHEFWQEREEAIAARARGQLSPVRALACLRRSVEAGFQDALAFERETFLELRQSPQSAALRHVFFAERAAPRPPELDGIEARDIARTAVVGGGTMGAGIAAALLSADLPVHLVERDDAALDRGMDRLRGLIDAGVERGRVSPEKRDARLAMLSGTTDYAALGETDLVVEAVFEDLDVKREVFAALDAACRADTVIATNTSYLDPRRIAEATSRPDRVLGLHFFSPAHVMKLLEIVPTPDTSQEVLATGFALARRLGKIPVRAGICEGFIGNRILKVTRAQAETLLLTGAAPADVDRAMRAFGLPMGPFEAQDLGGLDIAAFQRQTARANGDTPFAPIADRLVAEERLGQKTDGGWYDYEPGVREPRPSARVASIIAEEAEAAGLSAETLADEELAQRIIFPMIDEGARILDEGIARRASDIDLVQIHGYGFPRWRGGLMHYAVARGLGDVVAALDDMSARGLAPAPSARLRAAAEAGGFEG